MQTGAPDPLNPDPPRYETPHAPQQSRQTPSHVTSSAPAKRITFFKSGDAQFSGVRMAIHHRSFKCFNALLDDLSQKVPLPFGVRTITTPRGTHCISRLEQLQDGGCYLCSDRRHAKPIDMEAAGRRPVAWHHSPAHGVRRKPSRPEEAPVPASASRYHRHPKRVVLVKNNDPAVRRTIVLSRRTARTLRAFMDQVSELLHCYIRKLYTLDGRKIDSIQSLMQCPSVLVCVGREPFRPLLVESFRKNSDERLPGLASRSRSSIYSEGQESRKNVNFGLETKKSIIHPRSDSSNRSTRFSLSSEKSYPTGLNMSPGNSGCVGTCPHAKESMMNDDIEKRVLVNKDGSLSVEMKVRFRLLNDEMLQWSTEIKKSSGAVNECCLGKGEEPCFLPQGKSESFSEPESISACEAEDSYTTKIEQMHLEESHCQNCCNHCQEYDIWKHPLHGEPGAARQARSSCSSTSSSRRIVCKKESVESLRMGSRSSEEFSERVVEQATCMQQMVEGGDTRVEYCTISRCSNHSGAYTVPFRAGEDCSGSASSRDQVSVKVTQVSGSRPISAVSNSSLVLEALKENQDDEEEDDDLPPSISRASLWSPGQYPELSKVARGMSSSCSNRACNHLSPQPPNRASCCSACSKPCQSTQAVSSDALLEQYGDSNKRAETYMSCRCRCGAVSSYTTASETDAAAGERDPDRVHSSKASRASNASVHSSCVRKLPSELETSPGATAGDANERSVSTSTQASGRSRNTHVCSHCNRSDRMATPASQAAESPRDIYSQETEGEAELRTASAASAKTNTSAQCGKSSRPESTRATPTAVSEISEKPPEGKEEGEEAQAIAKAVSAASVKTRTSTRSNRSLCSACGRLSASSMDSRQGGDAMSDKTSASVKSRSECKMLEATINVNGQEETEETADDTEGRAASAVSAQSRRSRSSNHSASKGEATPKPEGLAEDNGQTLGEEIKGERAESTMSAKMGASRKYRRSEQSQADAFERAASAASTQPSGHFHCENSERVTSVMSNTNTCERAKTPALVESQSPAAADEEGLGDTLSLTSKASRSKSRSSSKQSHRTAEAEAAAGQMNADVSKGRTQSAQSVSSRALRKPKQDGSQPDGTSTPVMNLESAEEGDVRAGSTLSVQTKASGRSKKSSKCRCDGSVRGRTPASEAGPEEDRATSAMSERSAKTQHSESKRALTPTSAVSISIETPEEKSADDAHNRVDSAMSKSSLASAPSTKSESQSKRTRRNRPVSQVAGENEDTSERAPTPLSASSERPPSSQAELMSVISTASRKSKQENCLLVNNTRNPSVISNASSKKTASLGSRLGSKASKKNSAAAKHAGKSPREVENGGESGSNHSERDSSVHTKSRHTATASAVKDSNSQLTSSVHSPSHSSVAKDNVAPAVDERLKSNLSNASSCLQVKDQVTKPDGVNLNGSIHSVKAKSSKKDINNDTKADGYSRPNSSASQTCLSPRPPKEKPSKHKGPTILLGTSGDSILSHSLSAADLLRENAANSRPTTERSKSNASHKTRNHVLEATDCDKHANDGKSDASSKSRHKRQVEDDISELVPSSLPNASPTEVVKEWLKKIPSEGSIYEVGDDFDDCCKEAEFLEVHKEPEDSSDDVAEAEAEQDGVGEKEHPEEAETVEAEEVPNAEEPEQPCLTDPAETAPSLDTPPSPKCPSKDAFHKGCHSSVQVMKILLSSKLDRCNSLPEVSPVYGRKLSTSAKGLLDCLAKLHLVGLDPADAKAKNSKYQEVMDILQSLWLSEPTGSEHTWQKNKLKDHGMVEDEYNPRSSSGVDVSGSSGGSGNSLGVVDQSPKSETVHGRITPVMEQELQDDAEVEMGESEKSSEQMPDKILDIATPDIASRVQGSPGNKETDMEKDQQDRDEGPASDETIRSIGSPKDVIETPSSSNKSSGNDSNPVKSPEETDPQDTSSGTPPSVQRTQLTKKASQDPDPVWVLNLLKKLEKQFMTHYVSAMAEFKVRWDLDDSVILDTMINELRDEVQKRIQSSINRELKKIQSRVGRGPRPPLQAVSRDSTLQTEQRRRRLKVMRNQSINASLSRSEENLTATDYSDQRSEDEYCPCDACMKKKMATRFVAPEFVNPPPLSTDFDLRKILQKKQLPSPVQEKTGPQDAAQCERNQDENDNLEVLEEEAEAENEVEEQEGNAETTNEEEGHDKEEEGENEDISEENSDSIGNQTRENNQEGEANAAEAEKGEANQGEAEGAEVEVAEASGGEADEGEAGETEADEGEVADAEAAGSEADEEEAEMIEAVGGDGAEAEAAGGAVEEDETDEGEVEEAGAAGSEVEKDEVDEGEAEEAEATVIEVEAAESEEDEAEEGEAEKDEAEEGEAEEAEVEEGEGEEAEAVEGEAEEAEAVEGEGEEAEAVEGEGEEAEAVEGEGEEAEAVEGEAEEAETVEGEAEEAETVEGEAEEAEEGEVEEDETVEGEGEEAEAVEGEGEEAEAVEGEAEEAEAVEGEGEEAEAVEGEGEEVEAVEGEGEEAEAVEGEGEEAEAVEGEGEEAEAVEGEGEEAEAVEGEAEEAETVEGEAEEAETVEGEAEEAEEGEVEEDEAREGEAEEAGPDRVCEHTIEETDAGSGEDTAEEGNSVEDSKMNGAGDEGRADNKHRGQEEEEEAGSENEEAKDKEEKNSDDVEETALEGTDEADDKNSGGDREEEFENQLTRQITKSSIESRQGSLDDSVDSDTAIKTNDMNSSHGNSGVKSNHMNPASSDEEAKERSCSSTEEQNGIATELASA
ncbi:hypothetical protein JZ751_024270, partial [Albula glossodonta]